MVEAITETSLSIQLIALLKEGQKDIGEITSF